jgi:hypothetical protein
MNMKLNLKVLTSALGIAALAITVLASAFAPASAQTPGRSYAPRGSVYGPYYNPSYSPPYLTSNGTGTVADSQRDPHNDR